MSVGEQSGVTGRWSDLIDRATVLLGQTVPDTATEVDIHEARPKAQPNFVEVYVRWLDSLSGFERWLNENRMHSYGDPEGVDIYLPAAWRPISSRRLPWWTASGDTPVSSGERTWGSSGWLITKWESSQVFTYATETGPR